MLSSRRPRPTSYLAACPPKAYLGTCSQWRQHANELEYRVGLGWRLVGPQEATLPLDPCLRPQTTSTTHVLVQDGAAHGATVLWGSREAKPELELNRRRGNWSFAQREKREKCVRGKGVSPCQSALDACEAPRLGKFRRRHSSMSY